MQKLEIGGIYKHYKGSRVKVIGEGFDSESLDKVVVYMHLEDGIIWVRPKKMFLENVKVGNKKIPRFKRIKSIIKIKPKK